MDYHQPVMAAYVMDPSKAVFLAGIVTQKCLHGAGTRADLQGHGWRWKMGLNGRGLTGMEGCYLKAMVDCGGKPAYAPFWSLQNLARTP